MSSTLRQFFQSILPSVGVYVTAHIVYGQDGKPFVKQKALTTKDTVIDFCELNASNATDCWFAVASYKQGWHKVLKKDGTEKSVLRTHDNAMSAKALWLDIDVGSDKPYKTRQEASSAIASFIKELGLPRPWVVASGAVGMHLYFPFTEAVEKDEWQYLADRLKQACKELGVHADPARTADIASIPRCPLTWNMKNRENPSQVQIMVQGTEKPYEEYKQILDKFVPTADRSVCLPKLPEFDLQKVLSLNLDTQTILTKYYQPIKPDYIARPATEVLAGCEQLRLQNGASEPIWRGMLAVLRHCEHGRHVCHTVSKIDPRYNAEDTDKKLNYLEDNDVAPYTCNTFATERPEVCQRCPNFGMIKSPISVPKRAIPVVQVEATQADTPIAQAVTEQPSTPSLQLPVLSGQDQAVAVDNPTVAVEVKRAEFTEISSKNSKVNAGGCWARTKNNDGEWQWLNIYPYPVYPLQRVRGRTVKGETTISYIFRKHHMTGYDDIQIAGATLMGQTLNATLGDFGFLLNDKERKLMAGLLIDLLKETEHTIGEVNTTDRLGWTDQMDAFLLGSKLYKTNGTVVEIAVSGKAKPFSDLTRPMGSLEVWKQIANVYNREGLEWGQAVLAAAFASPLMPIGSLEKAALLFLTGEKGAGKSTALLLASSVFGNPERMKFNKMDTFNSRIDKLGVYSNIAAAFDEMTDMSPKEASEFAYTLTQGRGKDRMNSGGDGLMMNTTYWSCLPVMSANDSIINSLSQHSLDPTAQMSRVLEVTAHNINKVYSQAEQEQTERLVRQLPINYGGAGDIYMRYVTANLPEITEMIFQIEKRFKQHAELSNDYRFWTYMCTRMIVGTMIANKLGLVQYNVAKLFAYLVKAVKKAKAEIEKFEWTPESAVPQFLAANIPHRIVVTTEKRPADMKDEITRGVLNDINYVVQTPAHGREITMRVELDTGNCIIAKHAIREWCSRAGISITEFTKLLEAQYQVVTKRTKRDLGRQTVYRGNTETACIVVNMPKHLFENN